MTDALTDKQRITLAEHLERAKEYHGLSDSARLDEIAIQYREEVRPGRGHDIVYAYVDGDHAFTGGLDPYGNGYMAMAEVSFIHNGADDECLCYPCEQERAEEDQ